MKCLYSHNLHQSGATVILPQTNKIWALKYGQRKALVKYPSVIWRFETKVRHPNKTFLKYLQIRSYIFKTQKLLSLPTLSPIKEIATNKHPKRGLTSSVYAAIMEGSKVSSDNKRLAWCENLNWEIAIEDWQKICLNSQTQSVNTKFRLHQYQWLMRIYIIPTQLNKFNPNNPDTCYKCSRKGALYHCLWDSPHPIFEDMWRSFMLFLEGRKALEAYSPCMY